MASMTQYLQKKLVDHALGLAAYTMPTAVYVGLFTGSPGETGSQTSEVVAAEYARQELTSHMDATVLATGVASNASGLTFPEPVSDWGTIAYVGILDAASGGNMLFYEALPAARAVEADAAAVQFTAGQISLTMLGNATQYLQKKLLDHALGLAAYTMPTTVYVGLFTGDPGAAGSLASEVSGGDYARQDVTSAMNAAALATGVADNASAVTFPAPTADWGVVSYSALLDAATSGNMLFRAALGTPEIVASGAPAPEFAAGALTATAA